MRIWHDDIRRPPDDSWWWAKTNAMAIVLLRKGEVEEISLDHDLGDEEGMYLVDWMCANRKIPPIVTIHSWNVIRATEMANRINDYGHDVIVTPFLS